MKEEKQDNNAMNVDHPKYGKGKSIGIVGYPVPNQVLIEFENGEVIDFAPDKIEQYKVDKEWYFPLQKILVNKMRAMYPEITSKLCDWQVVTPDRVLEQWTVFTEGDEPKFVFVNMFLRCKEPVLLVYEMKFSGSN